MTSLNHKQKELLEKFTKDIEKKFPEATFLDVIQSPEGTNSLWVEVKQPADEDREIALREYAAELAMNILLDYGYHFLIQPTTNAKKETTI